MSMNEQIIDDILERLFTNGAGQEASRLLLIKDELHRLEVSVNNAQYIGGWNKDAVRRMLAKAMTGNKSREDTRA